jgi:hypothetical protein
MRNHLSGCDGANACTTGEVFTLRQTAKESGSEEVACTCRVDDLSHRSCGNSMDVITRHND